MAQVCACWGPRPGAAAGLWLIHLHAVRLTHSTLQQLPQVQGDVGCGGCCRAAGNHGAVKAVRDVTQSRPEGVLEAVNQVAAEASSGTGDSSTESSRGQ